MQDVFYSNPGVCFGKARERQFASATSLRSYRCNLIISRTVGDRLPNATFQPSIYIYDIAINHRDVSNVGLGDRNVKAVRSNVTHDIVNAMSNNANVMHDIINATNDIANVASNIANATNDIVNVAAAFVNAGHSITNAS